MIFFHGLRLYRLAAAEADMSYTPPFGGAIFFSMVRMIELLLHNPAIPGINELSCHRAQSHRSSCATSALLTPLFEPRFCTFGALFCQSGFPARFPTGVERSGTEAGNLGARRARKTD